MKKFLLVLLVGFSFCDAYAQGDTSGVRSDFMKYWELTRQVDLEGVADYLYPRLFEVAPRKDLINAMKTVFEDPSISLGIGEGKVLGISDVLEVDEVKYSLINYSFVMQMQMVDMEDKSVLDLTLAGLKEEYGDKSVRLDNKTNTFFVNALSQCYAIRSAAYDSWKFIERKKEYEALFEGWFPKKVLKKLK